MSSVLGQRAVVVGADIGGLSMAGALANHFEQVEVLERDCLTTPACSRPGTPQDLQDERPDVGVLPKRDFDLSVLCASRPLIELVLRRRAEAVANITPAGVP